MCDEETFFFCGYLLLLFLSATDNFMGWPLAFAICGVVSKTYPFTSFGSFMNFSFSLFSFSGVNRAISLFPGTEQLLYPQICWSPSSVPYLVHCHLAEMVKGKQIQYSRWRPVIALCSCLARISGLFSIPDQTFLSSPCQGFSDSYQPRRWCFHYAVCCSCLFPFVVSLTHQFNALSLPQNFPPQSVPWNQLPSSSS